MAARKKRRKPAAPPDSLPFPVPADLRSEEDVKIKFLLPYLESRGYKRDCINFNKAIEVHEGRKQKTIYADAVVYTTKAKTAPLIVCETKPPTEPLSKAVREQTISYARLLPRIAPLALITNGQTQVFQTVSKTRVAGLPYRKDLRDDFVRFVLSSEVQDALRTEAKHELFIIDDVQSFKRILKSCHDEIRNNEGYNPVQAFDEMTKVLFCKMHEEREHPNASNRFRTVVFDDSIERLSVNVVSQIWSETKTNEQFKGLFEADSTILLEDRTIRKIVSMFESYDLSLTAFDVKGEAFEYFLGETFTGGLGQYFTPRNVVEFMVDAVNPKIGQRVVDPFCGTGGFLIYAFEVVSEKIRLQEFSEEEKEKWKLELSNRCLFGTDWAERTTVACKMNMIVHGDGSAGISKHHGLVDVEGIIEPSTFDLCITNPPFGSTENNPDILNHYNLGGGKKSQDRAVLAIERALSLVKPGGTVAIIVIDGILNNARTAPVRSYIRQNAWVRAVISLPSVTFEGYHARAKTSILFLEKKPELDESETQEQTFMAVVSNSGYAATGAGIPGNELPEVLLDFRAFRKGGVATFHPRTWTTNLLDRMDAEFYSRTERIEADPKRVGNLLSDVSEQLKSVTSELGRVQSQLESTFSGLETTDLAIGDFFEPVNNPVKLARDGSYRTLGVRWWGGGTFLKEEKSGSEIKAAKLSQVEAGWIIYNRLFAFRGSFALISVDHDKCFVSNEFPTFKAKGEVKNADTLARYIVHCLNSPQYLLEVDRASTGSTKTSRNRFKEDRFLGMKVAIPTDARKMKTIVELMDRTLFLKLAQAEITEQLSELRDAIGTMLPMSEG